MTVSKMKSYKKSIICSQFPRENPQLLSQAEKIVQLLVDAGAHIDAVNAQGLTPAQVGHDCKDLFLYFLELSMYLLLNMPIFLQLL